MDTKQKEFFLHLEKLMVEYEAYICVDARGNLCFTVGDDPFPLIAERLDYSLGEASEASILDAVRDVFDYYDTPMLVIEKANLSPSD